MAIVPLPKISGLIHGLLGSYFVMHLVTQFSGVPNFIVIGYKLSQPSS